MSDVTTTFIAAPDGTRLAVHRLGAGRPFVLLHGLFSSAAINWIQYGTAARIAAAGFECVMPDLRAHGRSEAPHDPARWPTDVLVGDLLAVVAALGLDDFDLGGYSLGARTAVLGIAAGLAPRRLVLGGMGLEGLLDFPRRGTFFIRTIDGFGTFRPGDPEYMAQQFMKTTRVDRVAGRLLLTSVGVLDEAALARITMPTLVVSGADDHDNGSAVRLAAGLPDAASVEIPGNHMSAVTQRQLGEAIADFLSAAT